MSNSAITATTVFAAALSLGLGKTWSPSGATSARLYLNDWQELAGIEITRYGTGNVSSFYIDGVKYANGKAGSAPRKVWIDEATDEIRVEGRGPGFPLESDEIAEKIKNEILAQYGKKSA